MDWIGDNRQKRIRWCMRLRLVRRLAGWLVSLAGLGVMLTIVSYHPNSLRELRAFFRMPSGLMRQPQWFKAALFQLGALLAAAMLLTASATLRRCWKCWRENL